MSALKLFVITWVLTTMETPLFAVDCHKITTDDGREFIGEYDNKKQRVNIIAPFVASIELKSNKIKSIEPYTLNKNEETKELSIEEKEERKAKAAANAIRMERESAENQEAWRNKIIATRKRELESLKKEEERLVEKHNRDAREYNAAAAAISDLDHSITDEQLFNKRTPRDLMGRRDQLIRENNERKAAISEARQRQEKIIATAEKIELEIDRLSNK